MADLLSDLDGGVLRLTINRPDVRNALNDELMLALTDALRSIDHRSPVRVVVLTGAGDRAFCAGADLRPDHDVFGGAYARPTTIYADLLRTAHALPVPLVARVNGACVAGGMGLLAFCDLAVASSTARFGLPEVRIGLFPLQVAALLQRIVPPRRFAEMCLTGDPVTAEAALGMDLVNEVVAPEELDAATDRLVERVARNSPTAIRRGKHALVAIAGMTFDQAIAHMETEVAVMPLTEDAREGMAAFRGKRDPSWTGR